MADHRIGQYSDLPVAHDADAWWSEQYEIMEQDLDDLREAILYLDPDAEVRAFPVYQTSLRARIESHPRCINHVESTLELGFGDVEPPKIPDELVELCRQVDEAIDRMGEPFIWWRIDFTHRAPDEEA